MFNMKNTVLNEHISTIRFKFTSVSFQCKSTPVTLTTGKVIAMLSLTTVFIVFIATGGSFARLIDPVCMQGPLPNVVRVLPVDNADAVQWTFK